MRYRCGSMLAKRDGDSVHPDIVAGVPDSGIAHAIGYANRYGVPFARPFIKYTPTWPRSFMPTQQSQRNLIARMKLIPVHKLIKDKSLLMIDDSIVRGTTSIQITKMLRDAGATEVHLRISSPPFINPCYFGTDIDSKDKLIACRMSMEEIRRTLDVDTLGYLSIEHCAQIARTTTGCEFCMGCFTGKYPIDVPEEKPCDKFSQKLCNK